VRALHFATVSSVPIGARAECDSDFRPICRQRVCRFHMLPSRGMWILCRNRFHHSRELGRDAGGVPPMVPVPCGAGIYILEGRGGAFPCIAVEFVL